MELGQLRRVNEHCECCTGDHAVQALDVFLGYAALGAHLVDEAGDKPDHRVGHVAVFRVLEPALSVKALCNAAGNAAKHKLHVDNVKGRNVKQACPGGDLIRAI